MKIVSKTALSLLFIITLLKTNSGYTQLDMKLNNPVFKNKIFIKVGGIIDSEVSPTWGNTYSLGYGRYFSKNFSFSLFYTHSQTNTLKGSFQFESNPYQYIYNKQKNYINRYIGMSNSDFSYQGTKNGLSIHDAFFIKAAYDFSISKRITITPFIGVAYGWSKLFKIFVDSTNFVNDKLVGGSSSYSYEEGKVFGPHMGFDIIYKLKNPHHQIFFEPELILLTTPGDGPFLSTYEGNQFTIGYNYKF